MGDDRSQLFDEMGGLREMGRREEPVRLPEAQPLGRTVSAFRRHRVCLLPDDSYRQMYLNAGHLSITEAMMQYGIL